LTLAASAGVRLYERKIMRPAFWEMRAAIREHASEESGAPWLRRAVVDGTGENRVGVAAARVSRRGLDAPPM